MKHNSEVVVRRSVNVPRLTDPQGLFDYLLWSIVLLAVIIAGYILLFGSL